MEEKRGFTSNWKSFYDLLHTIACSGHIFHKEAQMKQTKMHRKHLRQKLVIVKYVLKNVNKHIVFYITSFVKIFVMR